MRLSFSFFFLFFFRYPALVQGAIASSAPIGCVDPSYNGSSYWNVVTATAGASCARKGFDLIFECFSSNDNVQFLVRSTRCLTRLLLHPVERFSRKPFICALRCRRRRWSLLRCLSRVLLMLWPWETILGPLRTFPEIRSIQLRLGLCRSFRRNATE